MGVLSSSEARRAEQLLTAAWGEAVELTAVEPVWQRPHVVRLMTASGRAAILKRGRAGLDESDRRGRRGFLTELACLTFLSSMPAAVAPRLLGADAEEGLLVMEELPAGHSLADSLLTGTSEEASGDLASYARALATVHAWSMEHRNAFETAPGSDRQSPAEQSWWVTTGEEQRQRFLETTAELGVRTAGVDEDIDEALSILRAGDYRGFVHGDPCPDNVRIEDGSGICRLFDFELSSLGSVALDAAYLLAPFPSCWCFSPLPTAVVSSAMEAYRQEMAACGVILGAGWDRSLVAAQACWLVGRAGVIRRSLDEDREWGTTTMRPRLLTWLRTFSTACTDGGTFERLHHLATDLADRLVSAWPAVVVPSYPAFAASDSAPANVPAWWRPRL